MTIKQRLIKICKEHQLTHVGSCLSAINGIDAVYKVKNNNEKFILSNGHAAHALYVVLESKGFSIEQLLRMGTHPDRLTKIANDGLVEEPIDCSTGSLGMGLTVAIGMAFANRGKNVYCMISDGEMAEGCIWESLRIIHDFDLTNLKLLVNANGYGAYKEIDTDELIPRFQSFGFAVSKVKDDVDEIIGSLKICIDFPVVTFIETNSDYKELKGLDSHYGKI